MANIKSAEKRMRQSRKRTARNRMVKSSVKTAIKNLLSAIEANDIEKAKTLLKKAVPIIDRAGAKKILHKNNASRKIARITKRVNSLVQKKAA